MKTVILSDDIGTRPAEEIDSIPEPKEVSRCTCDIPEEFLNDGTIRITVKVITNPFNFGAREFDAAAFKVIRDMGNMEVGGDYQHDCPQVVVRPCLHWNVECIENG